MGKKAVVAGATGMVGRELVDMLLRDERFGEVTVLVRSHMEIQHPKLTQIVVDFDRLDELSPDIVGHAVVFCALGTTIKKAKTQENFRRVDYGYPFVLGQLAKLPLHPVVENAGFRIGPHRCCSGNGKSIERARRSR